MEKLFRIERCGNDGVGVLLDIGKGVRFTIITFRSWLVHSAASLGVLPMYCRWKRRISYKRTGKGVARLHFCILIALRFHSVHAQ